MWGLYRVEFTFVRFVGIRGVFVVIAGFGVFGWRRLLRGGGFVYFGRGRFFCIFRVVLYVAVTFFLFF